MKRFILILFLLPLFLSGKAQTDSISTDVIKLNYADSIATQTSDLVSNILTLQYRQNIANRYKIYPTENIYTFLKLDTQTGKIDIIQWSLDSKEEFTIPLNPDNLSLLNDLNSFELYPTQNMYQFILLDKATGQQWHVQWGTKPSKRWIRHIL